MLKKLEQIRQQKHMSIKELLHYANMAKNNIDKI